MLQKDYESHVEGCDFRVARCEKCDAVKPKDGDCDCIKTMAAKYEHLCQKLAQVSKLLDKEIRRNEQQKNEPASTLSRCDIQITEFAQMRPQYYSAVTDGFIKRICGQVQGLPLSTTSIVLRFGLNDMNIRREYTSLVVYQSGSQDRVDITNLFMVGPQQLPRFG